MFGSIEKVPETSMHTTAVLNTFWEFTRGVEGDRDGFIKKALKVFKTFKVRSIKASKPDVPAKKTAHNLFCKDMQETAELKGTIILQASAIISREWKKVKARNEKRQKYRDLYKVEKQRYEEALQRY